MATSIQGYPVQISAQARPALCCGSILDLSSRLQRHHEQFLSSESNWEISDVGILPIVARIPSPGGAQWPVSASSYCTSILYLMNSAKGHDRVEITIGLSHMVPCTHIR